MNKKCLYCFKDLSRERSGEYHEQCSLAFFGTKQQPDFSYRLEQMDELARNVINRSIAVPGVQPKISLSLVNNTLEDSKNGRLTVVGALGGNYIFKPPSQYFPQLPENEHLTMKMADSFGIKTAQSSLIRLKSGELSFITKRFDRTEKGKKLHMIDMYQILDAFDKYKSSMEKVGKAVGQYSSLPMFDKLYYFELAVFSFVTGNNDMHLKNFSMLLTDGNWRLAPAYDLLNVTIANPDDKDELALTLEGKRKKLELQHFLRFGANLGLNDKQIQKVFQKFGAFHEHAKQQIAQSFLSSEYRESYAQLMIDRYKALHLI
ncbi:HipA domain-containing protein [Pedobacter endophyticus]|uniref:HipA domain-containing protein n=1 Tax=Pedobacter endophyticus TaxID=2789740 RepID=A0A7S9L263_9SPHI|nr:HipA domain-containing protein [Pedobacter endophyticus]QPH41082.1 HipA domain-containing protein [Pedobacter endophyticus]